MGYPYVQVVALKKSPFGIAESGNVTPQLFPWKQGWRQNVDMNVPRAAQDPLPEGLAMVNMR